MGNLKFYQNKHFLPYTSKGVWMLTNCVSFLHRLELAPGMLRACRALSSYSSVCV